jgi:hypothetical protein
MGPGITRVDCGSSLAERAGESAIDEAARERGNAMTKQKIP